MAGPVPVNSRKMVGFIDAFSGGKDEEGQISGLLALKKARITTLGPASGRSESAPPFAVYEKGNSTHLSCEEGGCLTLDD